MDPAAPHTKRHHRGRRQPSWPSGMDAFARNEALLLLHLVACQVLHAGRCLLAATTRTGRSLRRFRERVSWAGARMVLHAPAGRRR
jgi:hypothetical protein